NLVKVRDAAPFVAQHDEQHVVGLTGNLEVDSAAAAVLIRVPGDFRDGSGDARLILRIKLQSGGDVPRFLASQNHVVFETYIDGNKIQRHERAVLVCPAFATRTVTSSRPRQKSR